MTLSKVIKNIMENIENERHLILQEVNTLKENNIYSKEYIEVKINEHLKNYSQKIDNIINKINSEINNFIAKNPTKENSLDIENISNFNSVLTLVSNVNLKDDELIELTRTFKNDMLLMGILKRKLEENNKPNEYIETFKEYNEALKKEQAFKTIKPIETDYLNNSIYNSPNTLKMALFLNNLENNNF